MPLSPSVILSVWGRFHAFDLARELQKLDSLSTLITSYLGFMAARFGVEKTRIRSCPTGEVVSRIGRKLPWLERMAALDLRGKQQFERSARQRLKQAAGNIFVGFSGSSLSLLREAKARGMTTILERGSSHIIEQTKILLDEYAFFGRAFADTPEKTIEQELAEYQEADFVAVPSGFVADSFLRQGFPARKLLLNPYGADLALFQAAPVSHTAFRIIQVGGVSIRKGFHHVAQAFREAAIPNSELWFVWGYVRCSQSLFCGSCPAGSYSSRCCSASHTPGLLQSVRHRLSGFGGRGTGNGAASSCGLWPADRLHGKHGRTGDCRSERMWDCRSTPRPARAGRCISATL